MIPVTSKFVAATLPSGNILVADAGSLPQDLFLVTPNDFSKVFAEPVTSELKIDHILKNRISVSPNIEFPIERFAVSGCYNICAIGRHCLAILQPVGESHGYSEIDSFIYRCFPVCRYTFHPKASVELVHVSFTSTEKTFLSVLSTDCTLRLFDTSRLSVDSLMAPFRVVNLSYASRGIYGSVSSGRSASRNVISTSRISLAKCEPIVSIAFFDDASVIASTDVHSHECSHTEAYSFLPFMALRSNGDVYLGFVDISIKVSAGHNIEKHANDCQLAGPIKIHFPERDSYDDESQFSDLNACSMQIVSNVNFAKSVPLLVIASADGSIGHYLLINDPDSDHSVTSLYTTAGSTFTDKSVLTLRFPSTSLFAVERLKIACPFPHSSSLSTLTSWLYDPSCLRILSAPSENSLSYLASASASVFRITLPWLATPPSASHSEFVCRIADEPTFVESLFSLGSDNKELITLSCVPSTNAILIAVGKSLYGVPACAKTTLVENDLSVLTTEDPIFVSQPLNLASLDDVLPPSEDFVAVVQRALARKANLNPKLLSSTIASSKETGVDDLNTLYTTATGAVAMLAQEYFGRTDTAARQLARLQATCDARFRHVTSTLEKRLAKSSAELGSAVLPALANRIDSLADRLVPLVQRLTVLTEKPTSLHVSKSNVLDEVCVQEGFTDQLTAVEVNLAHINTLFGQVDEKARYLGTQIDSFTKRDLSKASADVNDQPPPTSLIPLFEGLSLNIRGMTEELNRMKADIDRIGLQYN